MRYFALLLFLLAALVRIPSAHAATFTVTKVADTADASCTAADCSLREAIIASNFVAGDDTISVPVGTYTLAIAGENEDAARTGDLDVTGNGKVTINGAGARTTIIQAGTVGGTSGNGIDRVFEVLAGGDLTINGLTVRNGRVIDLNQNGGGIRNVGTLSVQNSTLSRNLASFGGGIFNGGNLSVGRSTLRGNGAGLRGGGIDNSTTGTTVVQNSTLGSNVVFDGGVGGGIANSGTLTVQNSTLSDNVAEDGAGGGIGSDGTVNLGNTIVAVNDATGGFDIFGEVQSQGYNLIGRSAGATFGNNTTGNQLNVEPILGQLTDNGGPTDTFLPQSGSPAIDKGNSTLTPDQRGQTRPQDNTSIPNATAGGNGADIGAVEVAQASDPTGAARFVVTTIQDVTANDGSISLREAIINANDDIDQSDITFDATVFAARQTITLGGTRLPDIASDIDIIGPSAGGAGVTIDADGRSRIFRITGGTSSMSFLSMINGNNPLDDGSGGGAVGMFGGSNLTLNSCTLSGNSINNRSGGAISNNAGTLTLNNCTVSGNSVNASGNGGGISNGGTLTLNSCTVSGNSATDIGPGSGRGGGISNLTGTLTLNNSIVAGNSANRGGPDIFGPVASGDYNLVQNTADTTLSGTNNKVGVSPNLEPLKPNGGPTQTLALLAGSPAIDAGNSAFTTDQRGTKRPVDIAGVANVANGSDIGSFEFDVAQTGSNLVVNSINDTDDGTCGAGDCTLREAINVAGGNGAPSNTITFDANVFAGKQTITLSGGELPLISSDLFITGPTASGAGVTIDADGKSLIFRVLDSTSTFSNLTLIGGNNFNDFGGALLASGASRLTLNGCTLSGNRARRGGAIFTTAQLTLNNCTLSGNSSTGTGSTGGGGGIISNSALLTLNSCTVSGNSVIGGNAGGGIIAGNVTLNNSIVAGNSAGFAPDLSGTINAGDYNLIGNTQGTTISGSPSHNITGVDPKLGPLADNGGPTDTLALLPGSPAIDAGNSAFTTDQRGRFRPVDLAPANAAGGNGSDIGAFELNESGQSGSNLVVNKTDDHDDGVCGASNCTLREAINAANGNVDQSDITFDATVFASKQTLTLMLGNLPPITTNVSVSGPTTAGAGVTVAGTTPNSGAIFQTNSGTVSLSDLSVTNGSIAVNARGGTTTIARCTLSGNGFGISTEGGAVTAQNCTVINNSVAGIANRVGTINVRSCTVVNNDDGIVNSPGETTNVSNSIAVDNDDDDNVFRITDEGFNITSGSAADAGLQTGTDGKATLADNGGPTQTIALVAGSPAIDAGNSALSTDARGLKRPVDFVSVANAQGGNGSDIGSFETQDIGQSAPNFVVNSADDHDDGVCGVNDCTLREAVGAANKNGAGTDTISFSPLFNSAQTITLTLGEISITASVSIEGPGARLLSIDAGRTSRIFGIGAGVMGNTWQTGPVGSMTTLSGLSLVNGRGDGIGVVDQGDGGALISKENLVLNNCTLSGSNADNRGGAIFNSGVLTLNACTLLGNRANVGGAIGNDGTLTLNNCTLSGNSAVNEGGGLFSNGTASTLNSCTMANNSARDGGGIFINSGTLNLRNSIVAGNTARTANPDISGTINSGDFNLIGNTAGAIFGGNPTNNIINVDPKLDTLKPNGGPTNTIALLSGSPAINAGDPAFNGTGQFDQRGNGFPRVRGGRLDIGAFEAQNSAPVAKDDFYNATEDVLLSVNAANGVLSNDTDPDANTTLSIASNTNTTNGKLTLNKTSGAFTYQPNANFNGKDSFSCTVSDGNLSATATVSISVGEQNDAPTLSKPANVSIQEDAGAQSVTLTGISSGPANENGQTLVVSATSSNTALVADPTVSYTSPNTSGTLSFSPKANASGTATITVSVRDNGTSNGAADAKTTTQTFLITVNAVNDAPVAVDDSASTSEDQFVDIGVVANDTDSDGGTLRVSAGSLADVRGGTATLLPDGKTVRFLPDFNTNNISPGGFRSGYGFTYKTNDGTNESQNTAKVTVSVLPVNDAPVINSVSIAPVYPNTNDTLTASVLATDVENDSLTFSFVWRKNGQVIPNENQNTLDLSKPGNGDDGDTITVSATAFDGSDKGDAVTSDAITIGNISPRVVLVAPQNATDKVGDKRTFVLGISDQNGAGDIKQMQLLINEQLDWGGGATIVFSPQDGLLTLRRGDEFLTPIRIGSAATAADILDNGALRIVGREVFLVTSSDGLTLSVPALVRNGLVGTNTLFARAQDVAGAVDGASLPGEFGYVRSGTYTVQSQFVGSVNSVPTLSKLSPGATITPLASSGLAAPQNFVFSASDEDGAGDIESMWFLAGSRRSWLQSATFVFYPRSRRLFLRSDDGTKFLGGGQIGMSGILENSQVRLDLSKVQLLIFPDGKMLGLRLPLQAKNGLRGQNKIWLRVQDRAGATSANGDDLGFVQSGTWNITGTTTPPPPPTKPSGNSS